MPLASPEQLRNVQASLVEAIEVYCRDLGPRTWSRSGGRTVTLPSFLFPVPTGVLLLGIDAAQDRWALTLGLADDLPDDDVEPSFDLPVLTKDGSDPEVEFESLSDTVLQVRHTGAFDVVVDASAGDFFEYYDSAPSQWPVLRSDSGDRLLLFTLDLDILLYPQVYRLFSNLADLADYVTWYKEDMRAGR